MNSELDSRVRVAAFAFLDEQLRRVGGEVLPRAFLALCKLHHAAFDNNILGIRPDYRVEIRLDVLEESDGPMLKHGLQEFHHEPLWTPRRPGHRPNPEFLQERYSLFRKAS
jgi:hypothetical protein